MATTLKAILGAAKLDGGDAAVAQVVTRLNIHHDLLPAETALPTPEPSA